MNKKFNDEQELIIYALHDNPRVNPDGDFTEKKIAAFFNVSQSTISQSLTRTRDKQRIRRLEERVEELERELGSRKIVRIA